MPSSGLDLKPEHQHTRNSQILLLFMIHHTCFSQVAFAILQEGSFPKAVPSSPQLPGWCGPQHDAMIATAAHVTFAGPTGQKHVIQISRMVLLRSVMAKMGHGLKHLVVATAVDQHTRQMLEYRLVWSLGQLRVFLKRAACTVCHLHGVLTASNHQFHI